MYNLYKKEGGEELVKDAVDNLAQHIPVLMEQPDMDVL